MSKFYERLAELGFATYEAYLGSPHWTDFKKRYRESRLPVRCVVCKSPHIQLHHHTYARLGNEQLEDVTPLCREHHVAVHEWLMTSGKIFVEFTHEAVKGICPQLSVPSVVKPVVVRSGKKKNRCANCYRPRKRGWVYCKFCCRNCGKPRGGRKK